MELSFGLEQYRMSKRLSKHPKIGKIISSTLGTLNIGQYARYRIFKSIIKTLQHKNINTILDLGCGQGEYSFMMARSFPYKQILALDVEKSRLESIDKIIYSDKLKNINTHCGTIGSISDTRKFDFIYSIDVFEHILEEEMPFDQVYDKLNPGGYFFIKMPNKNQTNIFPEFLFKSHSKWLEDEHIGQVYELQDLENRLRKSGFKLIKSFYADGWLSRLSWELWYLSKKIRPEFQILFTPFLKILVWIDQLTQTKTNGNTIQALVKK